MIKRKNLAIAAAIKASSALGSYIFIFSISKTLTGDEFGKFSIILSFSFFLAALLNFGTPLWALRSLPIQLDKGSENSFYGKKIITRLTLLATIGSILGLLITSFFKTLSISSLEIALILQEFRLEIFLLFLILLWHDLSSHVLRCFNEFILPMASKDVVWRYISSIVFFYIYLSGASIDLPVLLKYLISLLFLCSLPLFLLSTLKIKKYFRSSRAGKSLDFNNWDFIPFWGLSILAAVEAHSATLVASLVLDLTAIGGFFIASRLSQLVSLPLVAAGFVGAPEISKSDDTKYSKDYKQRLCNQISKFATVGGLVGFFLIVAFGKLSLNFFGHTSQSLYVALIIMSAGQVVNCAFGPSGYVLSLLGHEVALAKINILANTLSLLLIFLLGWGFGVIGCAIGVTTGIILWNVWARKISLRYSQVDPSIFAIWRHA